MTIEVPDKQNWTQKILLKMLNTLNYSFYLTNKKHTAAVTSTEKNTDSRYSKPKKILR